VKSAGCASSVGTRPRRLAVAPSQNAKKPGLSATSEKPVAKSDADGRSISAGVASSVRTVRLVATKATPSPSTSSADATSSALANGARRFTTALAPRYARSAHRLSASAPPAARVNPRRRLSAIPSAAIRSASGPAAGIDPT